MTENLVGLALAKNLTEMTQSPYGNPEVIDQLIQEALLSGGLGQKNPDFPLMDIIEPGMTVLLKPNWVLHYNQSNLGMACMVTQPEFISAVLRQVAATRPGRVILGDAPLQGCQWHQLISKELVEHFKKQAPECKLEIIDFRRTTVRVGTSVDNVETDKRSLEHYILFDLGSDSMLEPVSSPEGRFRVTMYDSEKLAATHHPGRHQYVLCREAFEADIILNLPKLKTHRKTGLTAALKNLVGLNGNKDYLPHHRVGGPAVGGDCYAGNETWKKAVETYLDQANQQIGLPAGEVWRSRANHLLELHGRFSDHEIEGGWYGNDTCWRMVLDLNRTLLYGKLDGSLADTPQRQLWSLTDAIICGDGEGPLAPRPQLVGAVTFSRSAVAADLVNAALLRLDAQQIPLLREAAQPFRWPLVTTSEPLTIALQKQSLSPTDVAIAFGIDACPPAGWVNHCELKNVRDTAPDQCQLRREAIMESTAEKPNLKGVTWYLSLGKLDEAEKALKQLLQVDATNIEALKLMGRLYINSNRYFEAMKTYFEVLNLNPNDQEALTELQKSGVDFNNREDTQRFYENISSTPLGADWHLLEWTPAKSARFNNWSSKWEALQDEYFSKQVGRGLINFLRYLVPLEGRILDYGCGPGYLVQELLNAQIPCEAMDLSPEAVFLVNHKFAGHPLWRGAKLFSGGRLPYPDNTFDLIFCIETIEHILPVHMDSMLNELRRILKPTSGFLFITTPNSEILERSMVCCPECGSVFHRVQHVSSFSIDSLSNLLHSHNFTTAACNVTNFAFFQQPTLPPAANLNRLIGAGPHLFWIGSKGAEEKNES